MRRGFEWAVVAAIALIAADLIQIGFWQSGVNALLGK